ncbi:MAG: 6-hydroxymethylpterin diphosphokinase MptE-like protein [Candidatus Hodarchaeales archaeon]|jgi:uncharacterized Rossmann fold enzyme
MRLDKWNKEYLKIVSKLDLNIEEDIRSAKRLESLLLAKLSYGSSYILNKLHLSLKQPNLVVGAGPSLETDLNQCKEKLRLEDLVIIAVDGSCSLFRQLQIIPDIVITDLDGEWSAIRWAISHGAITLIHAHGDNQPLVQQFFTEDDFLKKETYVWGSTQNVFKTILFNFGGFTDGDRAIFLSIHFQSPLIGLIGFDFGEKIGKFSTLNPLITKDLIRKRQKFEIACSLLSSHYHTHNGIRFNLTSSGKEIPGFPRLSLDGFKHEINEWNKKQNKKEFPKDEL